MPLALCVNKTLDLLDTDFAVICEHKLLPTNFKFLETLHQNYTAFPQNQDAYTGNEKYHVSMLVKKSLLSFWSFEISEGIEKSEIHYRLRFIF